MDLDKKFITLPWSDFVGYCGFGSNFDDSTLVWPQKSSVIESTVSIPEMGERFKHLSVGGYMVD